MIIVIHCHSYRTSSVIQVCSILFDKVKIQDVSTYEHFALSINVTQLGGHIFEDEGGSKSKLIKH